MWQSDGWPQIMMSADGSIGLGRSIGWSVGRSVGKREESKIKREKDRDREERTGVGSGPGWWYVVRQGRGLTRHCSRARIRARAARIRRRAYPALVHVRRHRYSQSRKLDKETRVVRDRRSRPRHGVGRMTVEFRTGSTPISRGLIAAPRTSVKSIPEVIFESVLNRYRRSW